VMIASQIVVAWQSIVARSVPPFQSAVVSVGSFHAGSAFNVIADKAELVGTIRSFSPETDALLRRRMEEIAQGICAAFGATCDLTFASNVPAMINSEEGAALMGKVAAELAGEENVIQIEPMMVAEDVSEFLNRAPGCFVLVGASDPAREMHSPHHSATFDFDERVLPTGTALLAATALAYLNEHAA
jgi:amidohydrolase